MTELDALIEETYSSVHTLMYDGAAQARLRSELTRRALQRHCDTNPEFARFVDLLSHAARDIGTPVLPLLPSSLFKRRSLSLASVREESVVKHCTSSGTTGQSVSIVPRDETTLLNFFSSIQCSVPEYFGIDRSGGHFGIVLGPSAEEAGDLWFSYVLASLSISIQTRFFERDGIFDITEALGALREQILAQRPIMLVGPPARLLDLANEAAKMSGWPAWPNQSFVVSAGGWKTMDGSRIEAEAFRSKVAAGLRITAPSSIRDSFNMVELNSVLHECPHHRKHVPPWLDIFAVDPRTNVPLASGCIGILAFLDASATSYPCFILGDDFGIVEEGHCACGRQGKTVKIVRRMNRIEARGCALKMGTGGSASGKHVGSDRYYVSVYQPLRASLEE